MDIRIVNEQDIDEALDEAIKACLCICFPDDRAFFSQTRAWHCSTPDWTVIATDSDHIVGHVGLHERMIRIDEQQFRVAGVQNVFVLQECRGMRLCDRMLEAAMTEALNKGINFGMLFCVPELEHVYGRASWLPMPGWQIVQRDETGSETSVSRENIAMYYPLTRDQVPDGIVHLQGTDW